MPTSHSQIYIHALFAVDDYESLIRPAWKSQLYQFISHLFKEEDQALISIGGMPDHLHLLFRMRSTKALSDLMRDVKSQSSRFINDELKPEKHFNWQRNYYAFSHSRGQVDQVIEYIQKQEEIHKSQTFQEEFHTILGELKIPFQSVNLFRWI